LVDKAVQAKQIARRITRKAKLRKYGDVRAQIPGSSQNLNDAVAIAVYVAHRRINLRQPYFHMLLHWL
jgi:hypothetical protein